MVAIAVQKFTLFGDGANVCGEIAQQRQWVIHQQGWVVVHQLGDELLVGSRSFEVVSKAQLA